MNNPNPNPNNPPPATPAAPNDYKLNNVLGPVAYLYPEVEHTYGLSKKTRNNYLFTNVRNTTVRNSGRTTLMAAVVAADLPEVRRILREQGHVKEFVNKQLPHKNFYMPITALDLAIDKISASYFKYLKASNENVTPEKRQARRQILEMLINHPNVEITQRSLRSIILLSPKYKHKIYSDEQFHNLCNRIIQKLVLTQTKNPNSPLFKKIVNDDGLTQLLDDLISLGYFDLVRRLVEELHVDVNRGKIGRGGQNPQLPLVEAIVYGHREIIQYLVQHGADIHIFDNYPYKSLLHDALLADVNNRFEFLKFLVEDIGINHAIEINKAYLSESSSPGPNPEILEYLISKGATPSSTKGGRRKTRKSKKRKAKHLAK